MNSTNSIGNFFAAGSSSLVHQLGWFELWMMAKLTKSNQHIILHRIEYTEIEVNHVIGIRADFWIFNGVIRYRSSWPSISKVRLTFNINTICFYNIDVAFTLYQRFSVNFEIELQYWSVRPSMLVSFDIEVPAVPSSSILKLSTSISTGQRLSSTKLRMVNPYIILTSYYWRNLATLNPRLQNAFTLSTTIS